MVIVFFIFYLICMALTLKSDNKSITTFLAISCLVLAFMAGTRSIGRWADTGAYYYDFLYNTPSLLTYSLTDHAEYYHETGFYLLGVIVKTFSNSVILYFCFVALVSFFFINKSLRELSVFPLIGLCVYIARFMLGRNYMQIRAGVSYAILMLGIKYIQRRDWKRYFLIVFVAYLFHHSAILAVPVYFICVFLKPKTWYIYAGIILAFLVGAFGQGVVHGFIEDNATDMDIIKYTEQGGETGMVQSLGMGNPLIYYQTLILILYTKLEKRLAPIDDNYYVIRWCYLFSTMMLTGLCTYKVLSGRTSTMFATLEFVIIPSLVFLFHKRNRSLALFIVGIVLSVIFYIKS